MFFPTIVLSIFFLRLLQVVCAKSCNFPFHFSWDWNVEAHCHAQIEWIQGAKISAFSEQNLNRPKSRFPPWNQRHLGFIWSLVSVFGDKLYNKSVQLMRTIPTEGASYFICIQRREPHPVIYLTQTRSKLLSSNYISKYNIWQDFYPTF